MQNFESMSMAAKSKTRAHLRANGIDPASLTPKQFVDYAIKHGFHKADDAPRPATATPADNAPDVDAETTTVEADVDTTTEADAEADDDANDDIDAPFEIETPEPPPAPEANNPMEQAMLDMINAAIAHHNHTDDHFLPTAVKGYVKRAVSNAIAKLDTHVQAGPVVIDQQELLKVGKCAFDYTHERLEACIKIVRRRKNLYMCGPAGSGKTTMAQQMADVFKRDFCYIGRVDDAFQLSGYKNAHGDYVETPFYDAFVNGKLVMLDEMDRWAAEALTWANAALANGYATFGDGQTYTKHPDCIVIGGGNTMGTGHDNVYTAAQALDGSTMDRFVKVTIDYDESLERKLALSRNPDADSWVDYVQKCRKRAVSAGMDVIISPRSSIDGAELLLDGFTQSEVASMTFMAGLSQTDIATLKG